MKYVIVPTPVVLKNLNTGETLKDLVDAMGEKYENNFSMHRWFLVYVAVTLKTFAEHRSGAKIERALASAEKLRGGAEAVAALEDADWKLLHAKVNEAQLPGFVGMQLLCFGEAVEAAKGEKPAALKSVEGA